MNTDLAPARTNKPARRLAAIVALGAAVIAPLAAATTPAAAATPNQLCRTNSDAPLYHSAQPNDYVIVPANSLVRILDYRDAYHYLARYSGDTGQIERSRINQASCYNQ